MKTDEPDLDLEKLEELEAIRAELDQMPFGETWRVATDNYKGRLFVYAPALVKAAKREAVANARPMTKPVITDEMIRDARAATTACPLGPGWEDRWMRAALEAVAGRIVEGEREDIITLTKKMTDSCVYGGVIITVPIVAVNHLVAAIRARKDTPSPEYDGPNENLRALYARGKAMLSQSDDKRIKENAAEDKRIHDTDALRARVAELEAERDKWKADGEDVAQMLVQRDKEADEALDVALSNMAEAQLQEQALSQRVSELTASLTETLAVATRNEEGEFADRARSVLHRAPSVKHPER